MFTICLNVPFSDQMTNNIKTLNNCYFLELKIYINMQLVHVNKLPNIPLETNIYFDIQVNSIMG